MFPYSALLPLAILVLAGVLGWLYLSSTSQRQKQWILRSWLLALPVGVAIYWWTNNYYQLPEPWLLSFPWLLMLEYVLLWTLVLAVAGAIWQLWPTQLALSRPINFNWGKYLAVIGSVGFIGWIFQLFSLNPLFGAMLPILLLTVYAAIYNWSWWSRQVLLLVGSVVVLTGSSLLPALWWPESAGQQLFGWQSVLGIPELLWLIIVIAGWPAISWFSLGQNLTSPQD